MPLVSIHIICYNQEQFIRQALVSAIEQDYSNVEIIIADDCSTDGTREVIEQVLQAYPNGKVIKILNQQNLGITQNSNIALSRCKGEFIAFMGGDDVLLPRKITEQINWFMADKRRVLCGHDVEWIDQCGQSLNALTSDLVPISAGKGCAGFIKHGTPYSATSVMVRRARIPSYGFHPLLPTVSDWKLWLDVIREDGVYGYVPGVLAQYRRHVGNVTARRSWKIT
ncbi:MAG: glycosyltransferase family 2 protein, partial [Gallionella sp.]